MISIVVPIYNVEEYLGPCIESILNSTYKDIELLLVDDGSTDRSSSICDEYKDKDARVKVIHKHNTGVSDSRNTGLKVAMGEYVAFVDSDDRIHPRMLEVLYDAIISGDFDFSMVYGDIIPKQELDCLDGATHTDEHSRKIIGQKEYWRRLIDFGASTCQFNVIWNKLYKHSLIEGVYFKNQAAEDMEWLNRVCQRVNQGIIDEGFYYYHTKREGSLMRSDRRALRISEIKGFYECFKNMPMEQNEFRASLLQNVYSLIFSRRQENRHDKQSGEVNAIAHEIYKDTKTELLHSSLSLSRKMRILCFYHFPWLYNLLYKLKFGSNKGA